MKVGSLPNVKQVVGNPVGQDQFGGHGPYLRMAVGCLPVRQAQCVQPSKRFFALVEEIPQRLL